MRKNILFSSYIDTNKISTIPKEIKIQNSNNFYRYSINIPFKNREEKRVAIVIMKNPSKAGIYDKKLKTRLSDDTVYNVCDYIYKHELRFSEVIILNLFPIYGPTFKNITVESQDEYLGEKLLIDENDKVLLQILNSYKNSVLILAWGGYPNLDKKTTKEQKQKIRNLYRQRINNVLDLIGEKTTYMVSDKLINDIFPPHGKFWFDFEKLTMFNHKYL